MLSRVLVATLLLVPAPVATAVPKPAAVLRVDCLIGKGSAFRIGRHTLVSVAHVTRLPGCFIDGEPVKVTYASPTQDFTVLESNTSGPSLRVDCGGFVRGRKYVARGFARGKPFVTDVELTGTGRMDDTLAVLEGIFTVIPGMSGGPVIDAQTGRAVGTINMFEAIQGWSGSVPLSETAVCKKGAT